MFEQLIFQNTVNSEDDDNDDDELILRNGWSTKGV